MKKGRISHEAYIKKKRKTTKCDAKKKEEGKNKNI